MWILFSVQCCRWYNTDIHRKMSLHGCMKRSGEKEQLHLLLLVKEIESSTVKFVWNVIIKSRRKRDCEFVTINTEYKATIIVALLYWIQFLIFD